MKNATKFLSLKCSSNPWFVDRLIVSAFLYINEIQINNKVVHGFDCGPFL